MNDWTAGYVADIGYTFGYYQELNPLRARLALLYNGIVCPGFENACELGFGQGVSTNMHAATSTTRWWGTDFNPSQAGFARELAAVSGAEARLYDEAFADFCHRGDLPDFDFIGLHGIWSWINDQNREIVVDFVRRKLKVGGVLYISYNTFPGWAAFAPMRQLMVQHAEVIGSEGRGIVSRIDGAMDFAEKLLATDPLFAKANPLIAQRIESMKDQNRHYLAHEYFNRDWDPMHFATMAKWLGTAKVDFACSAHYLDFIDAVNLSQEQQAFLNEIPDRLLRQSTRDFMVNNQFRKDYWIKGIRRLSPIEQREQLQREHVVLQSQRAEVPLKVKTPRGEADMAPAIYNPLLDALADNRPHSIEELAETLAGKDLTLSSLTQAIMVLASTGRVTSAQDDATIGKVAEGVEKLNRHLIKKAWASNEISNLASPVTGGSVAINRFSQIFLQATREGLDKPAQLAQYAWEILLQQNQKLMLDGKLLESEEDNLRELTERASNFLENSLPVVRALRLLPLADAPTNYRN